MRADLARSKCHSLVMVAICGAATMLAGCSAQIAPDPSDSDSSASTATIDSADEPLNAGSVVSEQDLPISQDPGDRNTTATVDEASTERAAGANRTPDRRSRDKDQLLTITFDDLKVNIQADQLFEPSMATDRVRELDGQRVRIRGFLFPAIFQQTGIKSFPLVMNIDCKFGPGEQAHHVILVEMIDGASTSYTVRPIMVTGRLTLAPWTGPDGNTWALYHIAGERVD